MGRRWRARGRARVVVAGGTGDVRAAGSRGSTEAEGGVVCAGALGAWKCGGAGRAWWEPQPLAGAPTDRGAGPLPARSASTPETWAKFTQENLCRAERERLASVNLRGLIDCILRDVAEDLRLQCDAVNLAYERRCEELEDARLKLEQHLRKVGPARPSHAQDALRPRPGQPWGGTPVTRMRLGSFRRPLPVSPLRGHYIMVTT